MPGKCRPSLRAKTLDNVMRSNLSTTDKECIKGVFERCEAEPLRHGRWVEWWPAKHMILTGEEMLFRCSECDAKYADVEGMRYCSYCGAKMDGDKHDTEE